MSITDNQEIVSNDLLSYVKDLERIILEYAKYDLLLRKDYEKKIKNLAQLSINKGINIQEIAKDINQEKKNELILEKSFNEFQSKQNNGIEKDRNLIEAQEISNQIFCKDFYRNLLKFMQRKKDTLKITNLVNNANKISHSNNNNIIQNKYNKNQFESNNINDNKINNTQLNESGKSASKSLGRKRKFK